jgi:hypothetical protein
MSLFVEFWAGHIPIIYSVARQLFIMRETDDGGAAWQDLMEVSHNGMCAVI